MSETSKLQKYLMWYKVKELFSNGLNKSQIGIPLGLHRQTVSNFVNRVRLNHNLPKESEKSYRPYEKQPETPYGQYAQCDFGERWMKTSQGIPLKVYFFAMSLSRSRYKFIYFSCTPFTTDLAVYAHELAFEYFSGVPRKIVYDQDKVFLVKENLGDLILTHGFRALVREHGFNPVFCRKSDPESKGKIENVVKYVKYNFLRGREFTSIEQLNDEVQAWLKRTANGMEHHGIHRIPSVEFELERPHLMPYRGVPTIPSPKLLPHHVRKNNVITYKGNYYSVPTGTYQGHRTQVYLEEKEEMLYIYSLETGKNIAVHKICKDKGQLISNTSHRRDREAALDDYEATVRKRLPGNTVIDTYLSELRIHKNRNYRDNLQFILLRYPFYTEPTLIEAFTKCLEVKVFNGCSLMKVAESIRIHKGEALVEVPVETDPVPTSDTSSMVPDKTDISTFNTFFI